MTLSRTSRVLFALTVIALAAFAWFELPGRRETDRARDGARRLFEPFATPADRIEIVRPGERLVFEARATRWEMVAPFQDAAEYSRIATLLAALERGEIERNLGPTGDRAAYGLAPPAAILAVQATGDTLAFLELGAHTVDRAFAYAQRDDGDVVLVSPDIVGAATLPVDAYRDQALVRFESSEITAFAVRRSDGSRVRWDRRGERSWLTLAAGDTVAGDSLAIPTYLARLRGLRVRSFVDPADTAGVFARASVMITLYKRTPAPPVSVAFVARNDTTFWCRTSDRARVVVLGAYAMTTFDASVASLRDRRLLHFDPLRARRIEVATPDTSAVLARVGDRWALPNPALGEIDADAATDFVRALRSLQYRRAVDARPGDLEPPTFSLTIRAEGGTLLDELRGRAGPNHSWLVTSRSTSLLSEVPAEDVDALVARLRGLRAMRR